MIQFASTPEARRCASSGDSGAISAVAGAQLGWALARSWGPRIRLVLLWAGSGAGVLLVWLPAEMSGELAEQVGELATRHPATRLRRPCHSA